MSKINKQWFHDKFAERGLSQNKFAKMVGLDPSRISLLLNGKRKMKVTDVEMFSEHLAEPIEDVLAAAGGLESTNTRGVKVVGIVDDNGKISKVNNKEISVNLVLPVNVVAVQVQSAKSFMDGWYLFFSSDLKSEPVGERKLAIINNEYVGVLKRSYDDQSKCNVLFGDSQTELEPLMTTPILWIKP